MRLTEAIKASDVAQIRRIMTANNLVLDGQRIVPRDSAAKAAAQAQAAFWGQRQLARKILLNSLYGALLNEHLRFYDERLGQSVTLSGRSITRHMASTVNQAITGDYDVTGPAIIAGDTDSVYFSAYEALHDDPVHAGRDWSAEAVIADADRVAEVVNAGFTGFLADQFHVAPHRGLYIRAGRELVASSALFVKKKKYGALIIDQEGQRLERDGKPGKLKVMGLDLKRADTPKYMQTFLERFLLDVLRGTPPDRLYADVKAFRQAFRERPGYEKGAPKKVSNLTSFITRAEAIERVGSILEPRGIAVTVTMPGHVRASWNWNRLCDQHHDHHAMRITDGMRIIVCKLRPNSYSFTSIAYPVDQPHLPEWFTGLPFDDAAMEETIIDNKILNLVGVLEWWDMRATKQQAADDLITFD